MRQPLIYKGEIVECPRCEMTIGTITRDLYPYERFTEECIQGKYYQPKNGDRCDCKECGASWLNSRGPHIRNVGWV